MTAPTDAPGLVVAAWQADGPLRDVPAALRALDAAAADAAARGVRLLVCPELTLTGYDIGPYAAELAEPPGGPMAQAVAGIARDHGLAIAWSWPERDGEVVHISAELVDRDGAVLARHRKAHLYGPDEAAAYVPGDGHPVVATLDGYRVGLLVCYDIEFPEQVRLVALEGADVLACPTALMEPYETVSSLLVRARAYENQMAVVYANRAGTENDLTYCGSSCIVGADGTDLARAGDQAALVVGTVTPAALADARRANTHLADRRPDVYGGLNR
ncbi:MULTISPECIES: carbon-nitrogen hydrolase family protein [Pimelobacter]|uniref:carbon-nitrogen hydrolase family protein n=1 Tax=Pimelobacter TaxID=2044 RepID=UPI001C0573E1|nr:MULTISPECIES: carbon-nitrogen hydrolase family protein [Pimelobacter]UUW88154.1 carbon-nitrogen hydrolase family protein [Pimelobacter simplex]UUW97659.1 carbon-nitrogen hydrolase family protein [Pimelobacter simplex]